jgi:hypothetical protein
MSPDLKRISSPNMVGQNEQGMAVKTSSWMKAVAASRLKRLHPQIDCIDITLTAPSHIPSSATSTTQAMEFSIIQMALLLLRKCSQRAPSPYPKHLSTSKPICATRSQRLLNVNSEPNPDTRGWPGLLGCSCELDRRIQNTTP